MTAPRVDAIVIGAGAAGLAAAAELQRRGLRVVVVEARSRVGGRVDTVHDARLGVPIERGAEFVHGRPPAMAALARRARVQLRAIQGRVLAFDGRRRRTADGAYVRMQQLLAAGDGEGSFSDVLEGATARSFTPLERALAKAFVEGYYLAAPERQGRAALRAMTEAEQAIGADRSFRPVQGQAAILAPLVRDVAARCELRLSTHVQSVRWAPGDIEVRARGPAGAPVTVRGRGLVVTLPVGLFATGAVRFTPDLREHRRAAARLAMGTVVKVILRFRTPFWQTRAHGVEAWPDLGFVLAPRLRIPTWWTLNPLDAPVLVGWAGGPAAARLSGTADRAIVQTALLSISRALARPRGELEDLLDGVDIADWGTDPLAGGAYAVFPPGTAGVPEQLARPIAGTIFVAGEATTLGAAGTVHGALESGVRAARQLLAATSR